MRSHIHEVVRRLLELQALEERLAALRDDPAERTRAEALVESLRAELPASVLLVHDQMRARGRRSVAEVRGGVCSGCHLALGVGNVAAVRAGELRQCGHCARYLYVVEDPLVTPPQSPSPRRKVRTRASSLRPQPQQQLKR